MTTDKFCFYLQNRLIQASKTGGQWYSDTSPFSIPWCWRIFAVFLVKALTVYAEPGQNQFETSFVVQNTCQGILKGGSITVPLTSCLTGLESAV
jgi:hypothetical protein